MCGWAGAQSLWQMDAFSLNDSHGFNSGFRFNLNIHGAMSEVRGSEAQNRPFLRLMFSIYMGRGSS